MATRRRPRRSGSKTLWVVGIPSAARTGGRSTQSRSERAPRPPSGGGAASVRRAPFRPRRADRASPPSPTRLSVTEQRTRAGSHLSPALAKHGGDGTAPAAAPAPTPAAEWSPFDAPSGDAPARSHAASASSGAPSPPRSQPGADVDHSRRVPPPPPPTARRLRSVRSGASSRPRTCSQR